MEWLLWLLSGSSSEVRFGFKSGLFFGLGFAIAHKVVNDVMVPQYKACGYQLERLKDAKAKAKHTTTNQKEAQPDQRPQPPATEA
ncbi:hypothetical protein Q3G72_019808 [Acer saccharum]|nr:hypothetical protein Q3G72_002751 [Acer saccharum]KAK1554968.1 hypothetical protein Q3G72_019808 [Acer saccharum]